MAQPDEFRQQLLDGADAMLKGTAPQPRIEHPKALIHQAAVELAEAALALLHTGKAHPVTQAQRAYRAQSQGPLEERYVQKLMQYHRRKEWLKSPKRKDRV